MKYKKKVSAKRKKLTNKKNEQFKIVKKFNLLDIATADFAFEAFGSNTEELFINCAIAMNEIMTDTRKVEPKIQIEFSVESEDLPALLFDFLSEILFYKDSQGLVFSGFNVKINEKNKKYFLKCKMLGEIWDRNKHEVRTEVKAVTYHLMEIKQDVKTKIWRAQVILDV